MLWHGREHRLAAYLGAKAVRGRSGLIRVVQGGLVLEAELLERTGHPLSMSIGYDILFLYFG